jgi:hypothetical protein
MHISRSGGRQPAVGLKTQPAMAIGFRGVITFTTRYRMVPHGWLTRIAPGAALGGRMRMVANVWLRFARAIRFTTTAGLRQPLLVYDVGSLKNGDIRGAQTHVSQAAGVSPPWFGNGSRLRGTANNFRPITGAEPTSANRQPAVVR